MISQQSFINSLQLRFSLLDGQLKFYKDHSIQHNEWISVEDQVQRSLATKTGRSIPKEHSTPLTIHLAFV